MDGEALCGGDAVTGGADVGSGLYSGAAAFGRVYSTIGAVIGIIIGIILLIAGYSKLKDPHTATVMGTVASVTSCQRTPATQNSPASSACLVDVAYTVGHQAYKAVGVSVSLPSPPAVGQPIALRYNPADPKSVAYEISPRELGWGLIGGGVVIAGLATLIAVFARRSKSFAAVYGTIEGVSALRTIV